MKKTVYILFIVVSLILLLLTASCRSKDSNSTNGKSVVVYYAKDKNSSCTDVNFINGFANYEQRNDDVNLIIKAFDTVKQMDDTLINELNAGSGPDVICFNSDTTLDTNKLAQSGVFTPLDNYIKRDIIYNPEAYSESILYSGKVNGKQIFMPIAFQNNYLFYDSDKLKKLGFDTSSVLNINDFFNTAIPLINSEKNSDDTFIMPVGFTPMKLLQTYDIRLTSADNQKVAIDEIGLKKCIDSMKALFNSNEVEKANKLNVEYQDDPVGLAEHVDFMVYSMPGIPYYTWYNQAIYKAAGVSNMNISAFSNASMVNTSATISMYCALTKKASKNQAAYDLISTLANGSLTDDTVDAINDAPTNGINLFSDINYYTGASAVSVCKGGPSAGPITSKNIDQLNYINFKYTSNYNIENPVTQQMVIDAFSSYLNDKSNYDDCLNILKQKLDIYINE